MSARPRPSGLFVKAALVLTVLLVTAAAFGAVRAAALSSPSPGHMVTQHIGLVQAPDNVNPFVGIQGAKAGVVAAEKKPLVNWTWLAVGLGGVLILFVVMFLLTRVFGRRRNDGE